MPQSRYCLPTMTTLPTALQSLTALFEGAVNDLRALKKEEAFFHLEALAAYMLEREGPGEGKEIDTVVEKLKEEYGSQ